MNSINQVKNIRLTFDLRLMSFFTGILHTAQQPTAVFPNLFLINKKSRSTPLSSEI